MTGLGSDGRKAVVEVDQRRARVRDAIGELGVEGIRSFAVNLFKTCSIPRETIARAMRCSVETVDRDAKLPCLDVDELLAPHPADAEM